MARGSDLHLLLAGVLAGSCALAAHADPAPAVFPLPSTWRITHSHAAPWCASEDACRLAVLRPGDQLVLSREALEGPVPLDCPDATLATLHVVAEGLFEGGLPAPAASAAQALGLAALPAEVVRVSCANASFDFVVADVRTLLLALDNRIWTFSRAPGALADEATAEARVQRLLELHFSTDMGFLPETVATKREWLSAGLIADIAAWFAAPSDPDEAPEINGDPFTDTQEAPRRFAVEAAQPDGDARVVTVRFADGWREHAVQFRLVREAGRWQVDDVLGRDGMSLRAILRH